MSFRVSTSLCSRGLIPAYLIVVGLVFILPVSMGYRWWGLLLVGVVKPPLSRLVGSLIFLLVPAITIKGEWPNPTVMVISRRLGPPLPNLTTEHTLFLLTLHRLVVTPATELVELNFCLQAILKLVLVKHFPLRVTVSGVLIVRNN